MRWALALVLCGACSWSFGGAEEPCPPNGWYAAADITLMVGATATGAVAAYPCVGDVEQSGRARAIHCATAAVGVVLGSLYYYSARRGIRDRRRCRAGVRSARARRSARPRSPAVLDR